MKDVKLSCRCTKYPYVYSPFSSINKQRTIIVKNSFSPSIETAVQQKRGQSSVWNIPVCQRRAKLNGATHRGGFFSFFKQRPINNLTGGLERTIFTFVSLKTFFTILSPLHWGWGDLQSRVVARGMAFRAS